MEAKAQGWKTYTFGVLAIAAGLWGAWFGFLGAGDAATLVAVGLVSIGLRDAIAKAIAGRMGEIAASEGEKHRKAASGND